MFLLFSKSAENVFIKFLRVSKIPKFFKRHKVRTVLGIETSCDDTGVAIIDEDGRLLGETLNSQTAFHVERGGINPPLARDLHLHNIHHVLQHTLQQANLDIQDISVVATTTRPGLASCLTVGLNYSLDLVRQHGTPFMPIHHMQAHALTARFQQHIPFPYLVLLMSGGHCLVTVAKAVDEFLLLGSSLDDAPGEAFDKVARRLRLNDLAQCQGLSGGVAIETVAKGGDVLKGSSHHIMPHASDCNFSFAGLKVKTIQQIEKEEIKQGLPPGSGHLNNLSDFCAAFQYNLFRHIAKRLQRAILFCELKDLFHPHNHPPHVVLSGGVASNQYGRSLVEKMCHHHGYQLVCPPPALCTDNGLMIAWNGVELLREGRGISRDPFKEAIMPRCVIGRDMSDEVRKAHIKLPRIKFA